MVVLETTFLIDLLRGKKEAAKLAASLNDPLFLAAPTVMELWSGALRSRLPEKEKKNVERLLESFETLPLDKNAAKEAGEIEVGLLKKGMLIDLPNIQIAGIVRTHGEKLITRDAHFARIPGLRIEMY